MTRDEKLQRLLDKSEIEESLHRWASAVGRCDWQQVLSVFHEGAADAHGTYDGSVEDFVRWQQRHHEHIEQSVHFIGPILIEFAGSNLALSQAYVTVYQRFGPDARHAREAILGPSMADIAKPILATIVGRYLDRFERRNDVWKIAYRATVFEWIKTEEAPSDIPFRDGWTAAKRDKSDLLYQMRRDIGLPD